MCERVHKYLPELKFLIASTSSKRKKYLENADDELIKLIIECCYNTLNGTLKFSPTKKEKIRKHRNLIRKIAKAGHNLKQKKKILIQSGKGVFSILLPAIISIVSALISKK
jgi:hypothetical protein